MAEEITIELLKKVEILKTFEKEEYNELIPYLSIKEYEEGDVIIRQSTIGVDFHIIISGIALVQVQLFGDSRTPLLELGELEHFGGISLIAHRPATASIIAKTHMKCIILSIDSLKLIGAVNSKLTFRIKHILALDFCKKIEENIQKISGQELFQTFPNPYHGEIQEYTSGEMESDFRKLTIEKLITIQEKMPFFKLLTTEEFIYLAKVTQLSYHNKGEILFHEGDATTDCYFILWGTVQTSIFEKNILKVGVYGPGTTVGTTSIFSGHDRVFTATARESCITLVLNADNMEDLKTTHHYLWYKIYNTFCENIAKDLIRINNLFTHMSIIKIMDEYRLSQR